jgi:integrase
MPRRLPRYCCEDKDRHGNFRIYFRRKGQPKVRLHGTPWTPSFMEAYELALAGRAGKGDLAGTLNHRGKSGTWRWLCQQYFGSAVFKKVELSTQIVRRRILEETFNEPFRPGSGQTFADYPLRQMGSKAIQVLFDRKAGTPAAANARLKAIRLVFKYGIKKHDLPSNPALEVDLDDSPSAGHHTWTIEEVRQYMDVHPNGTKARRALALLLYTGVRRSDLVRLGPKMIRGGWLTVQPKKTKRSSGVTVEIPVLPALAAELELMPCVGATLMVTDHGKPFTSGGFYNKFKNWCREAGLDHCSPHGLRKAGATLAAENGATPHQLSAIFGWTGTQMAELYTRKADRKKLAASAMNFIRV